MSLYTCAVHIHTFKIDSGLWTSLSGRKGTPVNVQEHSMVFYRDNLYVFGGFFSHPDECPLWIYHTQVTSPCLLPLSLFACLPMRLSVDV